MEPELLAHYARRVEGMLLRGGGDRNMPRKDTLALLRDVGLTNDEAEAVIARGVALGILLDDGAEVRAS